MNLIPNGKDESSWLILNEVGLRNCDLNFPDFLFFDTLPRTVVIRAR